MHYDVRLYSINGVFLLGTWKSLHILSYITVQVESKLIIIAHCVRPYTYVRGTIQIRIYIAIRIRGVIIYECEFFIYSVIMVSFLNNNYVVITLINYAAAGPHYTTYRNIIINVYAYNTMTPERAFGRMRERENHKLRGSEGRVLI